MRRTTRACSSCESVGLPSAARCALQRDAAMSACWSGNEQTSPLRHGRRADQKGACAVSTHAVHATVAALSHSSPCTRSLHASSALQPSASFGAQLASSHTVGDGESGEERRWKKWTRAEAEAAQTAGSAPSEAAAPKAVGSDAVVPRPSHVRPDEVSPRATIEAASATEEMCAAC